MPFSVRTKASFIVLTGLIVILLFTLIAAAPPVSADPLFQDVETTWAKEHIISLTSQNIIEPDPLRHFRPNDPITRAELAEMLANGFVLLPREDVHFTDVETHPNRRAILQLTRAGIDLGSIGDKFFPDESISRAELMTVIVRVLDLDGLEHVSLHPSFTDLPENHRMFDHVEIALHLGLIPPYIHDVFQPNLAATRAEASAVIDEALKLQVDQALVETIDLIQNHVIVRKGTDTEVIRPDGESKLFRNGRPQVLGALRPGDTLRVISDRFGMPKLLIASGLEPIRPSGEPESPTTTRGILSPQDVRSIVSGDWSELQQSFMNKVKEELVERGIEPPEADALVERDWPNLRSFGEDRLAEMLGDQLGIDKHLVISILQGNFDQLQTYAEEQVLENVVGVLFGNQNNS